MVLKQVTGYKAQGAIRKIEVSPGILSFDNVYFLNLDTDSGTLTVPIDKKTAFTLHSQKDHPEDNDRYSPVLRARQAGLKPLGSLSYVSIDPKNYEKDQELEKIIQNHNDKKKKLEIVSCVHDDNEYEAFFELVDGSKYNMICSNMALFEAAYNNGQIKYKGEKVIGLKTFIDSGSRFILIDTAKKNIAFGASMETINELDGYDFKIGATKNRQYPDGRYTAQGLINELTLAVKSGIDVAVRDITINEFDGNVYFADIILERNGIKETQKILPSHGVIFGNLFDVPVFVEDDLITKQKIQQQMQEPDDIEEDSEQDEYENKPTIQ